MNTLLPTSDADARAAQEFECFVCNRTLPIDNVECKLAQGPVCKGCANHLDIDFIKRSQQIEGQQDECNACGAIEESEQDIEELVLPGSSKADDNYPDGCTDEEISMGYQLYSSPL